MCNFRREPRANLNNKKLRANPYTPLNLTSEDAKKTGTLRTLARWSTESTLALKLHQQLMARKVGTSEIEEQAYNQVQKRVKQTSKSDESGVKS